MSKVNPGKFSALGDPVQALGLKTSVGFVRGFRRQRRLRRVPSNRADSPRTQQPSAKASRSSKEPYKGSLRGTLKGDLITDPLKGPERPSRCFSVPGAGLPDPGGRPNRGLRPFVRLSKQTWARIARILHVLKKHGGSLWASGSEFTLSFLAPLRFSILPALPFLRLEAGSCFKSDVENAIASSRDAGNLGKSG